MSKPFGTHGVRYVLNSSEWTLSSGRCDRFLSNLSTSGGEKELSTGRLEGWERSTSVEEGILV